VARGRGGRKRSGPRAHQAQVAQRQAARRKLNPAASAQRRALSYGLFGLAVVVAVSHIAEHGGLLRFFSPGLEDRLIGYPTAAVLAILGAILLPRY
jgi:hypothetical protein